jgi:large subunit ribosomal protein L7/L12
MSDITKDQVIEWLSGQTVLEVSELVKDLEEKWGVSAAAPVAVAAAGAPAGDAPAAEERMNSTSSLLKPAQARSTLLKKSAPSLVSVLKKPRNWSKAHLSPSRKALPRTKQKKSRRSLKPQALKQN